jgi:hypothetical protein
METKNRDVRHADGRYGSSYCEDEQEPEHLKPLHWPWLMLIGLSALLIGVVVALMLG